MNQASNASAVIGTGIFVLVTFSYPIRLDIYELIWLTVTDLIWLSFPWFYPSPDAHIYFLIRVTQFDSHSIQVENSVGPRDKECPLGEPLENVQLSFSDYLLV